MSATPGLPDQPFWVDGPNRLSPARLPQNLTMRLTVILVGIYRIFELFILLSLFMLLAIKFPILWVGVALVIGVFALTVAQARRGRARAAWIAAIQQRALETTGAALLGSALHTAGHPLLKLNQPVVLALRDTSLSIYDYASSTPIDTIDLRDVQRVETVSYDDQRVAHVGAIQDTAQALQLTFAWRGQPCTCLFRRMYKVRPVEWYQALQTARLTLLPAQSPAS